MFLFLVVSTINLYFLPNNANPFLVARSQLCRILCRHSSHLQAYSLQYLVFKKQALGRSYLVICCHYRLHSSRPVPSDRRSMATCSRYSNTQFVTKFNTQL